MTDNQVTSIERYADLSFMEFVAASYYEYNDMNRLTKLVHSESTTAPTSGWGSDPLAGYQFSYDAASRFTSINSYLDGVTDYAHDDTNQLIGADHATATDESYEYDANGNRTMAGYDIDPNNQLYSDGTYNYTYDAEGNRLTRTKISNGYVTRYEWDFRNRLVKVTEEDNASGVLQFTENFYDAYNQWIRRNFDADGPSGTAAVDTFFVYENGQIVLQFDGNDDSDLSHRYLWGEQVDQLFADETVSSLGSAGTVIWPLGDHLGTLRDLVTYNSTTDDAAIANHREYDSYGKLTDESNSAIDLIFGFTGRAYDETTGLQDNLNRKYDAPVGRWLSEDPLGFAAGDFSLAGYVANSPLNNVDPSGLITFDVTNTTQTEGGGTVEVGGETITITVVVAGNVVASAGDMMEEIKNVLYIDVRGGTKERHLLQFWNSKFYMGDKKVDVKGTLGGYTVMSDRWYLDAGPPVKDSKTSCYFDDPVNKQKVSTWSKPDKGLAVLDGPNTPFPGGYDKVVTDLQTYVIYDGKPIWQIDWEVTEVIKDGRVTKTYDKIQGRAVNRLDLSVGRPADLSIGINGQGANVTHPNPFPR